MRIIIGMLVGAILALGAGWFFFRPMATAPQLVAPDGTVFEAQPTSTTVTLEWEHGGEINYQGGVPQTATDLIVCVYRSLSGQLCQLVNIVGTAPDFRHVDAPENFDRTPLTNVQHIAGSNEPFRYTFDVDIAEERYDESLSWTVGACGSSVPRRCAYAAPMRMQLTERNISVIDVSDNPNSAQGSADIDIEIDNTGTVETGPFELWTSVYEVLVDSSGIPLRDVNNISGVANWDGTALNLDDAVIMRDGTVQSVFLLDLVGEGQRDSSDVWVILRPGGVREFWRVDIQSIPADLGGTLEYKPCSRSQQSSGRCEVKVAHSMRPTAFAVISTADPQGFVIEFNEGDNRSMVDNVRLF